MMLNSFSIGTILKSLLVIRCLLNANAELKSRLQDQIVVVGDSLNISCSSNIIAGIHFEHNGQVVYAGGRLFKPYNDIFLMNKDTATGTYTLVLQKAKPSDAGVYMCREDGGKGQSSSADVIVLDSRLSCHSNMKSDGFIGPNTCHLQPDTMNFSCAVSFYGNNPPSLTWRSTNGLEFPNITKCYQNEHRISCILNFEPEPQHNGSVFICQATAPNSNRYSCSTEVAKIQYFSTELDFDPLQKRVNDEIICLVKSSQNVRYNWTLLHNFQNVFLSSNRSYIIRDVGMHSCRVSYNIRDITCSTVVSVVSAQNPQSDGNVSKNNTRTLCWPLLAVTLVVMVVVAAVCTGIAICFYRRRERQKVICKSFEDPGETEPLIFKAKPKLLHRITAKEKSKAIYGIAILEDELFAIWSGCNYFEVYSLENNLPYKRSRTVDDLKEPFNIIACSVNRCLYIEDYNQESLDLNENCKEPIDILRIRPNGEVMNKWPIVDDDNRPYEIGHISVTIDGKLIVPLWRYNKLFEYTFIESSIDNKEIGSPDIIRRVIQMQSNTGINYIHHAIFSKPDYFVLCQGGGGDYERQRVCIVDRNGKMISSYGDKKGCSENQFDFPCHMTSDGINSIIVADRNNRRLVVLWVAKCFEGKELSLRLKFERILLSQKAGNTDRLREPWRVELDANRGWLFVAQNSKDRTSSKEKEGQILVYSVVSRNAFQ